MYRWHQRILTRSSIVIKLRFIPGNGFKQMASSAPLVEEAGSENTELWLIQLPTYELGPKDLMDKLWTMHPGAADNTLGHFYNSRGELYDVVKQDAPMRKLFAILPGTSQYSVRTVETTVCFRKHHDLSAAVELTKPALKVSSESKRKGDSNKLNSKRSLIDEKQSSTMTEASVGNKEGEAEVEGQKKKKKKKKKRSKTEESAQS